MDCGDGDTHQHPKPHGMPKTEGMDLNNLTVMDLRWRTIMRITAHQCIKAPT